MSDAKAETLEQAGFSTNDLQRNAGDVIKSKDWNKLVNEIGRLGTDKVDLMKGEQTMPGSLAIAGPLTVLDGGTKDSAASMVVQKDKGGALGAELSLVNKGGGPDSSVAIDFGVGRGVQANGEGNAQIKVTNLGTDNATRMSISTWDGKSFDERMAIFPGVMAIPPGVGVGIGTATPGSALDVQGDIRCLRSLAIGGRAPDDYPQSGLDVSGDVRCRNALKVQGNVRCSELYVQGDITCHGRVSDEKVRKFVYTDHTGAGQCKTGMIEGQPPDDSLEVFMIIDFESRARETLLRFDFTDSHVVLSGLESGGMAHYRLLIDGESMDECWEGFGGAVPMARRVSLTRILSVGAGQHTLRVDWGIKPIPHVSVTGTPELWSFGNVQLSAIEL